MRDVLTKAGNVVGRATGGHTKKVIAIVLLLLAGLLYAVCG